jgi:hypothetical protein
LVFPRTILTFILVAWLPVSCCCRLAAIEGVFSDVMTLFQAHHHPHACSHADDGDDGTTHDSDQSCECPAHDQVYVRAAATAVPAATPAPVAIMPVPPVVTAVFALSPIVCVDDDRAETRIRACSTLLRLHCALTI